MERPRPSAPAFRRQPECLRESGGVLMVTVVLLVVQGFVINRLAGIPYPVWSPRLPPPT